MSVSVAALQVSDSNTTFDATQLVVEVPDANKWFYLAIQNTLKLAQPIHLHGHDFYVLGQAEGTFDDDNATAALNLSNPPRRDVAMLPRSGYLVLGFYSDNPGVWLLHCHVGWHTGEGLALQIVERDAEILALYLYHGASMDLAGTCQAWNEWQDTKAIVQDDLGI